MTTTVAKKKPISRKLTIDEMVAREIAAHDRYVHEIAKEMSRSKKTIKATKKPK